MNSFDHANLLAESARLPTDKALKRDDFVADHNDLPQRRRRAAITVAFP